MSLKTKIIFGFCKGEQHFEDLAINIKEELYRNDLVINIGSLKDKGIVLKFAILDLYPKLKLQ